MPIGAPIVGFVADRFGARWSLSLAAASGFAAAIVGIHYLVKYRNLSMRFDAGRIRFGLDEGDSIRTGEHEASMNPAATL
jgi:MFS family permease